MAESIDPFDAALSALGDDGKADPQDEKHTDKDPFAAGGDSPGEKKEAMDPFEAAKLAEESDAEGADSGDAFDAAMEAMGAVSDEGGSVDIMANADTIEDDPFASALEVAKTEHSVAAAKKSGRMEGQKLDIDFLMEIKLTLTFEVGRAKMYISDLLSLGQGSVIELHRLVGEELDIFVNGEILATGEVVVVNEKFGARIENILSPEARINRLAPTL